MASSSVEWALGGYAAKFYMDKYDGQDFILNMVDQGGLSSYEVPLPDIVGAFMAITGGCYLDIGANNGLYALLAAKVSSNTKVIAFEPMRQARELLLRNIEINEHADAQISVSSLALSNFDGRVQFFETVNPHGFLSTSSSLDRSHADNTGDWVREVIAECGTLDRWVRDNPVQRIDLVKIDVEGAERTVLEGAQQTFARFRPCIVVELLALADFAFIDDFCRTNGYVDIAMFPNVFVAIKQSGFYGDSWNHLLVPAKKIPLVRQAADCAGIQVHLFD